MTQVRWFRRLSLVAVVVSLGMTHAVGAVAQTSDIVRLELVPQEGHEIVFGGRTYAGTLSISWQRDGLAVVEEVPLDGYLAGIREVPLSWPDETLKAQAVAARTYLAWTLSRGRTADGLAYDFDICATTQCQVYAGTGVAKDADGPRWLAAIAATEREILVFDDTPAQTLYSSSSGSRTRAVQDVFGGEPKPYLQPVDSPEAGVTPYEAWEITLDVEAVRRILARAGFVIGSDVRSMDVARPAEGTGPASLVITSDTGTVAIPATTVRTRVNQYGPLLYPGLLPAARPDGRRWPQAFLSYTFDVAFVPGRTDEGFSAPLPTEDLPSVGSVTFAGEGWGHGVGMSQWGAYAMGSDGSAYDTILGHYYGGLVPEDGGAAIPDRVRVGLAWGRAEVTVGANGPFLLRVNGVPVGEYGAGEWSFRTTGSGIGLVPPPELAAAVRLIGTRPWPR